ncbi:uncharacterized protein LOC129230265 [Uloborus diversus]|uniref:uncharacterized protein LOC129230265 n=1 Tax=Uloborus diversus TaxID=327109 RepID=UPI00240953C1|nr:uncharacterized protein LOC129230265 [Uloborus diversus]
MDAVNKAKRTVFRTQTTKLINKIDAKFIEDLEDEILKCDEYNSNIVIWRSIVKRAKTNFEVPSHFIAPTATLNGSETEQRIVIRENETAHINLPRLIIDKFDGDPSDWQRFWDQYESAIHKNTDISNVDKFNYLRSYLKGAASNAIKGFSLTNNNYQSAIDTLKDRFGKKTIVINSHLNKLLSLNAVKRSNDVVSLRKLFDTCQTEIRNLESLGVTEDSYGTLLCPILIRLLPNDIVLEITKKYTIDDEWKVSEIMKILKAEVISREKAATLISSSSTQNTEHFPPVHSKRDSQELSHKTSKNRPSTASELLNETKFKGGKCFFCEEDKHLLRDCKEFKMKQMSQKRDFLMKLGCCFICFNKGHLANKCRSVIKCRICSRRHYEMMCPDIKRSGIRENSEDNDSELEKSVDALHSMTSKEVLLQTLVVKLIGKNEERNVRAVIDTGSQFSYILKPTVIEMGFKVQGEEELSHSLFGGAKTKIEKHRSYKILLADLKGSYTCSLDVLDQNIICNDIPSIRKGPWLKELKMKGIHLTDVQRNFGSVEVHLGADVAGKLFTGKREELASGLVALHTKLGWTLLGKVPQNNCKRNFTMSATTMLSQNEMSVSKLWDLEIIGIRDPIQQNSKEDAYKAVMNYFQKTVKQNEDGRYEVNLPWKMDNAILHDNYNLSLKRLESTCRNLDKRGLRDKYDEVFDEWIQEGIIEELSNSEIDMPAHYLPHRPVIKEKGTTKIRPVFDASSKGPNHPSLNDCLETGINLIETIPSILARFRVGKIGVVADIKRAFLQISVNKEDRDFLRFLWYNKNNELTIFRHTRVVFGVTSSAFLLSAVLDHHLYRTSLSEKETRVISEKLRNSFYVDNCVTSVHDKFEAHTFIEESTRIMKEGRFELRGWETTALDPFSLQEAKSNVLGLVWDKNCDSLEIDPTCLEFEEKALTKRNLLSLVGKFFDPIGFLAPVLIQPKLLLQEMWKTKLSWDIEASEDKKKRFLKWKKDIPLLQNIKIPRWLGITPDINISFHTFVDASQVAYAACVFIRCEYSGRGVSVQLLQAKARITPLKPITIPRLELMAATIGARLYVSLKESLSLEQVRSFFWTDSSTVLAWIKRPDQWSVFVRNRVNEIRKLTEADNWFHIIGRENIADLLSRGCGVKQLLKSPGG